MAGKRLHAVAEREQPAKRMEESLGALAGIHSEVRAGHISDEEGVSGQDEPRVGSARAVDHRDRAVLGPVAGRVEAAQDDVAERDLGPVCERVVRVLRGCSGVDRYGHVVFQGEAPVARDVVGVRVRLDDAHDAHFAFLRFLEVLLDRECGIDDCGDAGLLVTDEIRRTPEVLVHELREDHSALTLAAASAISLEVTDRCGARGRRRRW